MCITKRLTVSLIPRPMAPTEGVVRRPTPCSLSQMSNVKGDQAFLSAGLSGSWVSGKAEAEQQRTSRRTTSTQPIEYAILSADQHICHHQAVRHHMNKTCPRRVKFQKLETRLCQFPDCSILRTQSSPLSTTASPRLVRACSNLPYAPSYSCRPGLQFPPLVLSLPPL